VGKPLQDGNHVVLEEGELMKAVVKVIRQRHTLKQEFYKKKKEK